MSNPTVIFFTITYSLPLHIVYMSSPRGMVPSVSPEDTDLLLHDYKTLKFFLCATRGPPTQEGDREEEEEEEEEDFVESPSSYTIFKRRPTTQPNFSANLTYRT